MVMRIMMMNLIDILVTVVGSNLKMMEKMIPDDFKKGVASLTTGDQSAQEKQCHLCQSEAVFGAFKHFHPFFFSLK